MKTHKVALLFAAALGAVALVGCSTPESRIGANPEAFAKLNPQQQSMVKAGQVGIGFSMDAVKLALGDPDRVTMRTDASGQTQIWHYVTYEYDDEILYTGYYHRYWRRWGGWWGPAYPWYLDYPARTVHDRFQVEFKDGKVVEISQEVPS
jgi:outer membrane protein assembly factor BamE (lipoprotein component of BamABCDE complex)